MKRILLDVLICVALLTAWKVGRHLTAHPSPPQPNREYAFLARKDLAVPSNCVVCIGDSLMHSLPINAVAIPAVNYGVGGDTTSNILRRMPDYKASISSARAVVLEMGINDLAQGFDNQTIVSNIHQIVAMIPTNVPVFACKLFPVAKGFPKVEARRITELNALLPEAFGRCKMIDTSAMATNGFLRADFDCGDGIHWSPAGVVAAAKILSDAVH